MAASPLVVYIWYQDTESLDKPALEFAKDVLCQEKRTQQDCFRFHENRREYAMAHSLLRPSFSMQFPDRHPAAWRFEEDIFGMLRISGRSGLVIALE
jgi:4'-phosphopantetheinyl transferase